MSYDRIRVQHLLPNGVREYVRWKVEKRIACELRAPGTHAALRCAGVPLSVGLVALLWALTDGGPLTLMFWVLVALAFGGVMGLAALAAAISERKYRLQAWEIERTEWESALDAYGIEETYPR